MQTKIQKWGNSLALRIPKSFAKETNIVDGSEVDLLLINNQMIIKPVKRKKYKLENLLSEVKESNIHEEISFGRPERNELL